MIRIIIVLAILTVIAISALLPGKTQTPEANYCNGYNCRAPQCQSVGCPTYTYDAELRINIQDVPAFSQN